MRNLLLQTVRLQHKIIRTVSSMKTHDEDACDNDYEQNAILIELHLGLSLIWRAPLKQPYEKLVVADC